MYRQKTSSQQKLVSISQLAEILGVSARTVQRMKEAGVIRPYMMTDTCQRYDPVEVLAELDERRQEIVR